MIPALTVAVSVSHGEVSDIGGSSLCPEIAGDGLWENDMGNNLENSIEMPINSFVQQCVEGDGIGEGSLGVAESGRIFNEHCVPDLGGYNSNANPIDGSKQGDVKIDDKGQPYLKDGVFLSNNEYELNGFTYITDNQGRIIHGEGKVSINDSPRPSLPKIDGMEDGDDRGHIIAHVLGGSDTEGNLVPMDSTLNRGEYKSMELGAKKALEEGKIVNMSVDIEYDDSKRPISFTATLEIDDDITVKKFYNNAQ